MLLLDYGHGGKDPGAVYQGRKESHDVLKLGQAVAKRLRAAGIVVDETRTSDATLSLDARVKIALIKGQCCISATSFIHCHCTEIIKLFNLQ